MIVRAIVCPEDVPENFHEIIIVFAEAQSTRNSSGTMTSFSEALLTSLAAMNPDQRIRSIRQLCSNLQYSLLQSVNAIADEKAAPSSGTGNPTAKEN